jgi:hypothetical protein
MATRADTLFVVMALLLQSTPTGPGTFGIYSRGVNGVDERGAGADVPSWAQFDRRFYSRRGPWDWLFWTDPVAVLALLIFAMRLALRRLKVLANCRN